MTDREKEARDLARAEADVADGERRNGFGLNACERMETTPLWEKTCFGS
jgi:hypothetical protein